MKLIFLKVSTWFANARRRLKKENKMTWSESGKDSDDSDHEDDRKEEGDISVDSDGLDGRFFLLLVKESIVAIPISFIYCRYESNLSYAQRSILLIYFTYQNSSFLSY